MRSFCAEVGYHDVVSVYEGVASRLDVAVAVDDAYAVYDAAAKDLVADLDLDAALIVYEHFVVAVFGRADAEVVRAALSALAPPLSRRETLEKNLLEKALATGVTVHELVPLLARADARAAGGGDDDALRDLVKGLLLLFSGDRPREQVLLRHLDARFPRRRGADSWAAFVWPAQRKIGKPER